MSITSSETNDARLKRWRAMEQNAVGQYYWYYPESKDRSRFSYDTIEDATPPWPVETTDALLMQDWPQNKVVGVWYGTV